MEMSNKEIYFNDLDREFSNQFIMTSCVSCVDCGKQCTLVLTSKNLMFNARNHLSSALHKIKAKKTCASSSKKITTFFVKKDANMSPKEHEHKNL